MQSACLSTTASTHSLVLLCSAIAQQWGEAELSGSPCRPDGSRAEIYLKREDLNHTGAHKINNSLGQALLCLRMNKRRIIAETGAGQHGVATVRAISFEMQLCGGMKKFTEAALVVFQATVCAKFGLPCIIYMGAKDMERQALNVFRMRLLGAEARPQPCCTAPGRIVKLSRSY